MPVTIELFEPLSPLLGKRVELRHSYGLASSGLIVELGGGAGETLFILFDGGPLGGRMAKIGPLPRGNRNLEQPVTIDGGNTLSLIGGA